MLLLSTNIHSESFSTTNCQLLTGSKFQDHFYGYNTNTGEMRTLTLEHFGVWDYGDNFFFMDLVTGQFLDFIGTPTGNKTRMYGEWSLRLSVSKLLKSDLSILLLKDMYLAGQVNRDGEGFHAELIGLGSDLNLPLFSLFSFNAYSRKDNFNSRTWQTTFVWILPLSPFLHTEGFMDLYGSDNNGMEIGTQSQVLVDIGALLGKVPGKFQVGLEWYIHNNDNLNSSVPQAMLKWIW